MNIYKPMKSLCRATFAQHAVVGGKESVDRENGILHGVQITLEGEAKGHGIFLDRKFCEDVVAQGNTRGEAGVKVRFGHPAQCSDALGTYLGRARNFRLADVVRPDSDEAVAGVFADIHLDKNADRYEWVLNMAESAPDTFGQSIVFTYSDFKVVDADGVEHYREAECGCEDETKRKTVKEWEAQSADGKVYAVLGKLHGTDFTDTPAATDGVFSADGLAAEVSEMLDAHPQILETLSAHPEKMDEFVVRYNEYRKANGLAVLRIETGTTEERVAKLQAAKDKELAEFAKKCDAEKAEIRTACETALAEANGKIISQNAEIEELEKKLGGAQSSLGEFEATVDALNAEKATLEKTLAEKDAEIASLREQLARECEMHKSAVGAVLSAPSAKTNWTAAYRTARKI